MKTNKNIKASKKDFFTKFLDRDYIRQPKKKIKKQYLNIHENYIYFQERNIFQEKDSETFNDYLKLLRGLRNKKEKSKHSTTQKSIKSLSPEKKIMENGKLRTLLEKNHKNIPSSLFDYVHPYEYLFMNKSLKLNRTKSSKRNKILTLSNKNDSENIFITTSTNENGTISTINNNLYQNRKNTISYKSYHKFNDMSPENINSNKNKRRFLTRKSLTKKNNNKNKNINTINNTLNLNNAIKKRPMSTRIFDYANKKIKKSTILNIINPNTNSNTDLTNISRIHDRTKSMNNSHFLNKKINKKLKSTSNTNDNTKNDKISRNVLSAYFSRHKNNKNKQQLYSEILNINSKLDEIKNNIINILQEKKAINIKEDDANQLIVKILSEKEKYTCHSSRELYDHLKQKHHIKNLTNQYMVRKNNFRGVIKQKFIDHLQKIDEREKRENKIKNMIYMNNFELKKEVNKLTEKDFEKTLNNFNKNNIKIKGMVDKK